MENRVSKQQQPTKNKKFSHHQSKAGTSTKASQGSESGSSEESSSSLSEPKPTIPSPYLSRTPRRRSGRRGRTRRRPNPPTIPTSPKPSAALFSSSTTRNIPATKETLLLPFFIFNPTGRLRTCEIARENGRKFSPPPPTSTAAAAAATHNPPKFFKTRRFKEQHWGRRDRGSPRRAHCEVYGAQRPPQQGLHCQRPKGPPCEAICPHCHSILRCPRPPRLRPPQ